MTRGAAFWLGRLSVVGAAADRREVPVREVLRLCRGERTRPVVCRNLEIPCEMERTILGRQLLAAHQAAEILREIEAIPLKGLHLAHRVYPSPGLRDMGDIDLLVRRSGLPAADGTLRSLGYVPERELVAPDEGPLRAVNYVRPESMPVHLHWSVSNASLPHFMYRVDMEEIWREAAGGEMAAHHLIVTLCEHALKHSFSELILLTDIEIASRGADWGRVAETARRWGLEGAVYFALSLLRDLMGVRSPGLDFVDGRAVGGEGRAFLSLARRRRWNGLSALGFLSMAKGWGDKARFIRESLAPGREASDGFSSRTLGRRARRAAEMVLRGVTRLRPLTDRRYGG